MGAEQFGEFAAGNQAHAVFVGKGNRSRREIFGIGDDDGLKCPLVHVGVVSDCRRNFLYDVLANRRGRIGLVLALNQKPRVVDDRLNDDICAVSSHIVTAKTSLTIRLNPCTNFVLPRATVHLPIIDGHAHHLRLVKIAPDIILHAP